MSAWLLGGVAIAYLWVTWGYFQAGRIGMGLAFLAYAIANLGFLIDLLERK